MVSVLKFKSSLAVNLTLLILLIIGVIAYVVSFPVVHYSRASYSMYFVYKHIEKAYKAKWVDEAPIGNLPAKAHIKNIKWISYKVPYCASTCLQMIAYKYDIKGNIGYFNLIMGFTYGAFLASTSEQNKYWFIPFGDPISGLRNASQILGLKYIRFINLYDNSGFSA